jgi:hypothetical protein
MANEKLKTWSTNMGTPPSSLSDFKNKEQIDWVGSKRQYKGGQIKPTHGDTNSWVTPGNEHSSGSISSTLYGNLDQGWNYSGKNGNEHLTQIEFVDGNRWMPAEIYNGFGFEVYQSSDAKHAVYLERYCLIFTTGTSSYRRYAFGGNSSDGKYKYQGYRYIKHSDSSHINTIRSWTGWYLYGFCFQFKNQGGAGSDTTSMQMGNFRYFHKTSDTSNNYRIIVPKKRDFSLVSASNMPFDAI